MSTHKTYFHGEIRKISVYVFVEKSINICFLGRNDKFQHFFIEIYDLDVLLLHKTHVAETY